MSTTPTKASSSHRRNTSTATANQTSSGAASQVKARATRRRNVRYRLLAAAVVIGLMWWLGSWVVGAATLVYGAYLRSMGWTWARVALHLGGAAIVLSLVVFVATTFGPGPGLLATVAAILVWRWDSKRPMAVRAAVVEVAAVDLETQLEAAFAEGFNRGQREAKKVRKAMERSVPAFDPDDPDSF